MNRLIINTANDTLEIVLQKDKKLFSRQIKSLKHHNETMLKNIDTLLAKHEMSIDEIMEFGVVIGPGSFTGIRVGIATVKAFRDALKVPAFGINNLDYLFALSKAQNPNIDTVAILGSRDSYFVAKLINGVVYKFEHNLTKDELVSAAEGRPVGMFKQDPEIYSFKVDLDKSVLLECLRKSKDENLVPVYYQLSQAEREKFKKASFEIIPASKKDLAKIFRIESENIQVNTLSEDDIRAMLDNEIYYNFVALYEGEIIGYILSQDTDEYNIVSIGVDKDYRNLGLGTKLIQEVEALAKNERKNVSLEVKYDNISALLLYKKLGYQTRRIRKNYYKDGMDCLEMEKSFDK